MSQFGHTWWGEAWIDALEQQARLDPNRLPRGRAYANKGMVYPVTIEPGEAGAYVEGSRAEPYQAGLGLRTFTDDEWQQLFEVIVAKAEHAAALADGELDPSLVDDAAEAGVHILPQPGDIEVRCSCPDWAAPCKHAAALAYRVADELDADPFALLTLRGRTREQVLASVRRLRTEASAGAEARGDDQRTRTPSPIDEGIEATEAWSRAVAPLPDVPALRLGPAQPPAHPIDPPLDATFTADGLTTLARDAAERAWEALATDRSLGLDAGFDDDVVRRAVTARQDPGFAEVAERLGTSTTALARKAVAWEVGGEAGVAMANENTWPADPLTMSAARLAVEEVLRGHIRGDIDGNRLTLGDVQLRLSHTGQWWSFQQQDDDWLLTDGPVAAADELVEPRPGRRR